MKWIPILMALLLLSGCAAQVQKEQSYRQINMDEAIAMMEAESDYIILDVRTPEEFSKKHIPGVLILFGCDVFNYALALILNNCKRCFQLVSGS